MTQSLLERLADIIESGCPDRDAEELARQQDKFAMRRAETLGQASRCLAEVMADTGGGSHSHLHVHLEGPVRLVRSGEKMHLETIRPGAIEAAEPEEQD